MSEIKFYARCWDGNVCINKDKMGGKIVGNGFFPVNTSHISALRLATSKPWCTKKQVVLDLINIKRHRDPDQDKALTVDGEYERLVL